MTRFRLCSTLLLCFALIASAFADQKLRTRTSVQGQQFETTSYVKGQRMRDEMNFGPMSMITIHQCDLNQTIQVNDRTKTYMITKEQALEAAAPAANKPGQVKSQQPPEEEEQPAGGAKKGGVVTINTTVSDTGEKKDFFGHTARHMKTSMSFQSSPDACNPSSGKMETDGWYIDFEPGTKTCVRPGRQMIERGSGRPSRPECQDRIKYSGPGMMALGHLGYPVDVTTTMTDKDGKAFSMRQEALDISRATLDASLFEAPAGYKQAASYSEMMGMGNLAAMMGGAARGPSRPSTSVSRAPAPTPEVGKKQPGKLRVGVAALREKTGKVQIDGDSLRTELMDKLQRFGYEIVAADGANDQQITEDAKKKDCDYVLFTDVTAKEIAAKKKIGGMLGRLGGGLGAPTDSGPGSFEGTVNYRLFKINETQAELDANQDAKGGPPDQAIPSTFERESRDVAQQIQKDVLSKH